MTHAVVTIEIDPRNHTDLALPLNIPSHILANAIAEALEVDKDGKNSYSLAVKTEQGILTRIPAQSTLGDMSVLDGFILQLSHEKNAPVAPAGKYATLRSKSGRSFTLESRTLVIGRNDVKRGWVVDIDLSPFDKQKIVSRKHAKIENQKSSWVLAEDTECKNGTWLNGHKLTAEEAYPLQDGDEIIFGRNGVTLKFTASR